MKGRTNEEQAGKYTVWAASVLAKYLYGLQARWQLMSQRLKSRRVLRVLSDDQLKDVGLSRAQALREARRSCWH